MNQFLVKQTIYFSIKRQVSFTVYNLISLSLHLSEILKDSRILKWISEKVVIRYRNIDFLKGVLIILVILGHIIPKPLNENLLRYIIYSFHMPIFIGISGFLTNEDKLQNLSIDKLISKYSHRIIIPSIIAMMFYLFILHWNNFSYNSIFKIVIRSFFHPVYQLWFIPAFLSWIFIAWVAKKLKIRPNILLFLSFIISLIFLIITQYPLLYENNIKLKQIVEEVMYTFKPQFLIFFVFGNYIKHRNLMKVIKHDLLILLLSFTGIIALFFFPNSIASILCFYLFNLSLLIFLLDSVKHDRLPYSRLIEWIGINSLGIYLWHMVPIIISVKFFGRKDLLLYYCITLFLEVILMFLYYQLIKNRYINENIMGLVR